MIKKIGVDIKFSFKSKQNTQIKTFLHNMNFDFSLYDSKDKQQDSYVRSHWGRHTVVGPLRCYPPYTNGLVVHSTFFSFFFV